MQSFESGMENNDVFAPSREHILASSEPTTSLDSRPDMLEGHYTKAEIQWGDLLNGQMRDTILTIFGEMTVEKFILQHPIPRKRQ